MRKPVLERLKQQIWGLDPVDRICMLTASVLEHEQRKGADALIMGLIELTARMSAHLGKEKRYHIAERLRSAADRCELVVEFDEVQP